MIFKSKWLFDETIKYVVVEVKNCGVPEPIALLSACRTQEGVIQTLERLEECGIDMEVIQVFEVDFNKLKPVKVF